MHSIIAVRLWIRITLMRSESDLSLLNADPDPEDPAPHQSDANPRLSRAPFRASTSLL